MTKNRSGMNVLLGALGLAGAALIGRAAARRARRIDMFGRVVVITGGGRGLGFAVAQEFLERGCKVAICGRDGDTIAKALRAWRGQGADVFGGACDASNPAAVKTFMQEVLDHFGVIDVLVNNAGQCFVGPAVELRPDEVESALRNIFWVHYYPTMAVLPHMRRRGFGRIVNITSIGGKLPMPHQAAYAVGKYAATGWSETLTAELAKEGICVSTITPPPLKNGAPLHVHFNGRVEDEFRWFAKTLTSRLVATGADRTARVVVDAAEHGDPERAVSLWCWLAIRAHGLLPNLTASTLALADRQLPPPAHPGLTSGTTLGMDLLRKTQDAELQALGATARSDAKRYEPN